MKRERVNLHPERDNDDLPFPRRERNAPPSGTHGTEEASRLEQRFAREYLACHRQPERAAMQVGIPARNAMRWARERLHRPRVKAYIAQLEFEAMKRQELDADLLIRQEYFQATTSVVGEIFDVHVPPCRHCWGINNEYQETFAEQQKRFRDHMKHNKPYAQRTTPVDELPKGRKAATQQAPIFDPMGGDGYDIEADPNDRCPNCFGKGDRQNPIYIPKPLNELSLRARMLIAGIQHKDGKLIYQLRDQDAALARLTNGLRERALLRDEGGRPIIDLTPPNAQSTGREVITRITRRLVWPDGSTKDMIRERHPDGSTTMTIEETPPTATVIDNEDED